MMRFRARHAVVPAVMVGVSLFAIASASGSRPSQTGRGFAHTSSHLARMTATTPAGVRRTLLSKEGTVQPGTFAGAIGTCPKKFPTPVSGWFSAKSEKVALATSIPIGKHKWAMGVSNFDTVPSDYIVGIVCVK
jgi:hypothetical protein